MLQLDLRVVLNQRQLAKFVKVGVTKIVAVPEAERSDVAAGQIDGRADEIRFCQSNRVSVQIAAPRVCWRVRLGLPTVVWRAELPAHFRFSRIVHRPVRPAVVQIVRPRRCDRLKGAERVIMTAVVVQRGIPSGVAAGDPELIAAVRQQARQR